MQSLWPKIDELRLILSTVKPDNACITETWLTSDTDTALINTAGFQCVRCDRLNRRGGGTAIYIRDGLSFKSKEISGVFNQQAEGIFLDLHTINMAVLCVYIPPSLPSASLISIREGIVDTVDAHMSNNNKSTLLIAGDFNHFKAELLTSDLDLVDIIREPTRGNHILDHVLVSKELSDVYLSSAISYNPPVGKADHLTIVATPLRNLSCRTTDVSSKVVYDFRMSNVSNLLQAASQENWKEIAEIDNINDMWSMFLMKLTKLVDDCIPQAIVHILPSDKSWMTPITKSLINDKWDAYRNKDWPRFNHLKEKVRTEVKKAKEIWSKRLRRSNYGLWQLTKHLSGKKLSKRTGILLSNTASPEQIAEDIANTMTSTNAGLLQNVSSGESNADSIWPVRLSVEDVASRLRNLPLNKASGLDGIPNKIYVLLADIIAAPLTEIFHRSLTNGILPSKWKEGLVVPIPKTNPPRLDKLRMITLLPTPSKILERLVLESVKEQIQPLYGPRQHAFRKGCSTTTALIQIMENATKFYDNVSFTGFAIMSFDLSKAFDRVDHGILMQKLRGRGFPSLFINWICNYLTGRTFRVKTQGVLSSCHDFSVGLPQGSVLGPALFCVMVGDITCVSVNSSITQHADDLSSVTGFTTSDPSAIRKTICDEVSNFTA